MTGMPPSVDATRAHPLVRPPGFVLNGVVIAMFAIAVWRGSELSGVLDSILIAAAAWFFLLLYWLFRIVAGAGAGTITARSAVRWAVTPSLFVIAGVLVFGGYVSGVRFAISRGALGDAADAALAGETIRAGWVGLYPVEEVIVLDGAVRFAIDGQNALVRDAVGQPVQGDWYEPVDDRWSMEISGFMD